MKKKPLLLSALQKLFNRRVFIILLILAQIVFTVVFLIYYTRLVWLSDLLTLFSVITALHLLLRQEKAAFKMSLIFLILLFPIFGGVFYWIFHSQTNSHGLRKRLFNVEKKSRNSFMGKEAPFCQAIEHMPEARKQLKYLHNNTPFPVYDNTSTTYYPSGEKMFAALLDDLKQAKKYIFLEYFIISPGFMWDSILEILKERLANGVDVRVIYDDVGSLPTLPPNYAKKLRAMGIHCERFNPFHPFLTSTQNNRDHRKIAVIDGKVAYTGGINLADEYIGKKQRFGEWKDTAVRLEGDGAWGLTVIFLQMWSVLSQQEENFEAYRPDRMTQNNSLGWVQPYSDSPMNGENVGEQIYLRITQQSQHYLYVTTPYLMADDNLMSALKESAQSGVDVRIITPEIPDKKVVHFTSRTYYRSLLEAGVKIYEFSGGFMHAKTVVCDDVIATVGTSNFDFRSLYLHFECGVCLYRTDSIADIKRDYLETVDRCREITLKDCKTNVFLWFWHGICRIFAPLM